MKIGFLGAGKMAEGILQAMLSEGVKAADVVMAETCAARAAEMAKRYGVKVVSDVRAVAKATGTLFLAVRPQNVDEVAVAVRPLLNERKLLVSIVAGKTLAKLRQAFGAKARIVRVMPNLALRVGEGMCAICGSKNAKPADLRAVRKILGGAGETVELKEEDFDAVTALSGSGPAYFAYMEQAMIEGGVKLGLKPWVARKLAEQTMLGTIRYVKSVSADLDEFIAGVCTKGGTTAAGMEKMSNPQFKKIVADTLAAAAKRSKELG